MNSLQKLLFTLSGALFFGAGILFGTLLFSSYPPSKQPSLPSKKAKRSSQIFIEKENTTLENEGREIQKEYNTLFENLYHENDALNKQLRQRIRFLKGVQIEAQRKYKMQENQIFSLQEELQQLKAQNSLLLTDTSRLSNNTFPDFAYLLELRLGDKITAPIKNIFQKNLNFSQTVTQVPEKLSPAVMDVFASEIITHIEQYSYETAQVEHFKPQLTRLVSANNREAAERVLSIDLHTQKLLQPLEKNLEFLKKKENKMLKESRRRSFSVGSVKAQNAQRLLDITSKKIQIQTRHKMRLYKFREAILQAISSFRSQECALFLMESFEKNKEFQQQKAILKVVIHARAIEIAPVLMEHLSVRHPDLTQSICETLTELTGVDHGKDRSKWKKWWAERQSLSNENS